ncbi:hypothetical protein DERF_008978 [Dermatophagoides farinae]|uniref:Uncharacterized protein n=1 Tax=Dermatophagoides farinae TaxID=6954 RepID=A0A922L082_DERFA|nr:hypothetical protein DERF_008978 [Dermatophagoides farinae]
MHWCLYDRWLIPNSLANKRQISVSIPSIFSNACRGGGGGGGKSFPKLHFAKFREQWKNKNPLRKWNGDVHYIPLLYVGKIDNSESLILYTANTALVS